jgi:hypothetical protein
MSEQLEFFDNEELWYVAGRRIGRIAAKGVKISDPPLLAQGEVYHRALDVLSRVTSNGQDVIVSAAPLPD